MRITRTVPFSHFQRPFTLCLSVWRDGSIEKIPQALVENWKLSPKSKLNLDDSIFYKLMVDIDRYLLPVYHTSLWKMLPWMIILFKQTNTMWRVFGSGRMEPFVLSNFLPCITRVPSLQFAGEFSTLISPVKRTSAAIKSCEATSECFHIYVSIPSMFLLLIVLD